MNSQDAQKILSVTQPDIVPLSEHLEGIQKSGVPIRSLVNAGVIKVDVDETGPFAMRSENSKAFEFDGQTKPTDGFMTRYAISSVKDGFDGDVLEALKGIDTLTPEGMLPGKAQDAIESGHVLLDLKALRKIAEKGKEKNGQALG